MNYENANSCMRTRIHDLVKVCGISMMMASSYVEYGLLRNNLL